MLFLLYHSPCTVCQAVSCNVQNQSLSMQFYELFSSMSDRHYFIFDLLKFICSQLWLVRNYGDRSNVCLQIGIMLKKKKIEITENPELSTMEQKSQHSYDTHVIHYLSSTKRYGGTAKPPEEATNALLASVSIFDWVIFLFENRKEHYLWKLDSCKNRNYILINYLLSQSVQYVTYCDLILDQRFLCV